MKRNFETRAEALDYLGSSASRIASKMKKQYGSDGKEQALEAILKSLSSANGADDLKSKLEKAAKKISNNIEYTYYSREWGFGRNYLIQTSKVDRWGNESEDRVERMMFTISGREVHLLGLNETISASDWPGLACSTGYWMLDELIYEYSVIVGDLETAVKIAEKFYRENECKGPTVSSDKPADYEPFLIMLKRMKVEKKASWIQQTLINYMNAFKDSSSESDRLLNSKIMIEFRDMFKHCKYSVFGVSSSKDSPIDDFDIIESSATARKSLFSMSTYEESRKMSDLSKRDPERLARIASRHFNSEHPNGARRSQFLRTYRKISDYIKINPMDLNTKLQSYVLLEEIN
jgi:hypothetical protein